MPEEKAEQQVVTKQVDHDGEQWLTVGHKSESGAWIATPDPEPVEQ